MKNVLTLLAVMVSIILVSACGHAEFDGKKVYQIIAKSAPRYIDIRGNATDYDAGIQINDNAKTDTQKWLLIKDENNFYQIISKASGKCLEQNTDTIRLADSTQGNNQKWILLQDREGFYLIISRSTGLAFDLTGAAVAAGTPIGAYATHAADSQKWSIMEAK